MITEYYKKRPEDEVYWVHMYGEDGLVEFGPRYISFDKKKIYNLWKDYPHNLTAEEKEIFDNEHPRWAARLSE